MWNNLLLFHILLNTISAVIKRLEEKNQYLQIFYWPVKMWYYYSEKCIYSTYFYENENSITSNLISI